jgi:hypothetical protein
MASVPFEFDCVKEAGFVMDPNAHPRFGYVLALDGITLGGGASKQGLNVDLIVNVPYNSAAVPSYGPMSSALKPGANNGPSVATVVGVIEKFTWAGGVGDALHLEFWVSQENATQIKSLQQQALQNTKILKLGWWIADYDPETKAWYEASFPMAPNFVSGTIQGKDNPTLDVDLNGAPVKDGIDVMVYKVTVEVVPAANQQYSLKFANSSQKNVMKAWGLQVGTLAKTAVPQLT